MFNIYPELNEKFPGNSSPFVILSDEWYILAGKPFPKKSFYGDYDLIENILKPEIEKLFIKYSDEIILNQDIF